MKLIYKFLSLVASLSIINWPVIPTLINLSSCGNGDLIIISCVGLSLLVPFGFAIIKYFSKLEKKSLKEEGVGLSFFAMLSGFLLTLVNGINTSRMLTLWFDEPDCLDNYYGKYISILASILTMMNGTTTIILMQRWLEFIDMFRLSKDSVWLVWLTISGTFGAFGGFMYHYLRKECSDAELRYYTILFGNLALFQLLTLIIMLIYIKMGTKMKHLVLARAITGIYGLLYVPFNFFWLIKGIIMLWSPDQECLTEHVLFAAILMTYGLTTSPMIFGILAIPVVYAISCLISQEATYRSGGIRKVSDDGILHGPDESEYLEMGK